MTMKQFHRKRYIRFKWWQYGRWFTVIIFAIFCLGFAAGFFISQRWAEEDKAALIRENAALRQAVLFF
jgi:hypothetical protein